MFSDDNWYSKYADITYDLEVFAEFKDKYYLHRSTAFIPDVQPPSMKHFELSSETITMEDVHKIWYFPFENVTRLGHQKKDMVLQCEYENQECDMR